MIPKLTALARSRSSRVSSVGGLAEHLGGGRAVHVLPALERAHQPLLAREVREDAQLDLRVVGGQQPRARLGHERAADLAAQRRAHRDVLQVRVRAREPAGGRGRLRERRVDAAVGGDRRGQGDQVRGVQLRELAPALDDGHDRVQVADLREHPLVGRVAGLALAVGGQSEPLEQHLAELLRRADRERAAGQLVGLLLELGHLVGHPRGDLGQQVRVDADAGVLHGRQHVHQRQLDVGQQPRAAALLQAAAPASRAAPARRRHCGSAPPSPPRPAPRARWRRRPASPRPCRPRGSARSGTRRGRCRTPPAGRPAGRRAAAPWRRARRSPGRRPESAASSSGVPSATSTSSSSATAARWPSAARPGDGRAGQRVAQLVRRHLPPVDLGAGRLARLRRHVLLELVQARHQAAELPPAQLLLERRAIGRRRPPPRPGRGRPAPAGGGGWCRGPSTRAPAPRGRSGTAGALAPPPRRCARRCRRSSRTAAAAPTRSCRRCRARP